VRAIVIQKFGGPENLVYKDIPEPEPKAGHVVIQVILSRLLQEKRR
jgi:NADPH:quinone reductase-like Zn-dependent oxidoreductase